MHDFIVVGAGPAGAAVAGRLARTKKAPKVLLLEAGGSNTSDDIRFLAERYMVFMNPTLNYGYQSEPQPKLSNRTIDQSRGRGLGGSSTINFGHWTVGGSDDWDRWARLVGDDSFGWVNMKERLKRLETARSPTAEAIRQWVQLREEDHGHDGPLPIEYPDAVEGGFADYMKAAEQCISPLNPDVNSGNPIGLGVSAATAKKSVRFSANWAFIQGAPDNLEVLTNTQVSRIIFDGRRAVGVEANGIRYMAKNEVILSAGAVDTPKILMLSGIGQREELAAHGIESYQDLPGVGKNLQDHPFVHIIARTTDGSSNTEIFSKPDDLEAAKQEFKGKGTGPYAELYQSHGIAFLGLTEDLRSHPSFAALPTEERDWISAPTVASGEIILGGPVELPLDKSWLASYAFLLTPQSRGTVTLRSADPAAAPVIDPAYFTNEFDRFNLIRTLRLILEIFDKSPLKEQIIERSLMPESKSDEDIWAFLAHNTGSSWHMTGTAKMGKDNDEQAVVDTQFRVRGINGLRVADMSVVPFVPGCHAQSWAYLVGETLAEKLAAQYHLN